MRDEQLGSKGPGRSGRQVVGLERTWLEHRTINQDRKGLVEAGDEQSGSKGHSWSVGQVVRIERAGGRRRQAVRLERTQLEYRMSGQDQQGLVEGDKWSGSKGHSWSVG